MVGLMRMWPLICIVLLLAILSSPARGDMIDDSSPEPCASDDDITSLATVLLAENVTTDAERVLPLLKDLESRHALNVGPPHNLDYWSKQLARRDTDPTTRCAIAAYLSEASNLAQGAFVAESVLLQGMQKDDAPIVRGVCACALGSSNKFLLLSTSFRPVGIFADGHSRLLEQLARQEGQFDCVFPGNYGMAWNPNRTFPALFSALASERDKAVQAWIARALLRTIRDSRFDDLQDPSDSDIAAVHRLMTSSPNPVVAGACAGALAILSTSSTSIDDNVFQRLCDLVRCSDEEWAQLRVACAFPLALVTSSSEHIRGKGRLVLSEAMATTDSYVLHGIAWAIKDAGLIDKEFVQQLVDRQVHHNSDEAQLDCSGCLALWGDTSAGVLKVLAEGVLSSPYSTQCPVSGSHPVLIRLLPRSGAEARPAISMLRKALRETTNATQIGALSELLGFTNVDELRTMQDIVLAMRRIANEPGYSEDEYVCVSALLGLSYVMRAHATKMDRATLDEACTEIRTLIELLGKGQPYEGPRVQMETIQQVLEDERWKRDQTIPAAATRWMKQHHAAMSPVCALLAYLILLAGMSFVPSWRVPLLKLHLLLEQHADLKLPFPGQLQVPVSLLTRYWALHPRVLDAWVQEQLKSARTRFDEGRESTAGQRWLHLPLPLRMDGELVPRPLPQDFALALSKPRACMVIHGEGGVGKTSLACQLGRWAMSSKEEEHLAGHAMIPILLEREFSKRLEDDIAGGMQDLLGHTWSPSESLLQALLRKGRLLIIVDHLSEMTDASRQLLQPLSRDFPVAKLIVTSRVNENLDGACRYVVEPLRIRGNRVAGFLEAYVRTVGKEGLLSTDAELYAACQRLTLMVGDGEITALLAKLFADQFIAARESGEETVSAEDVPELMLGYVNWLNRAIRDQRRPNHELQLDSQCLAWECVKDGFAPRPIHRDAALRALGGIDAQARLDYMINRLRLVRAEGASEDMLRVIPDPVCEYLSAYHYVYTTCKEGTSSETVKAFLKGTGQENDFTRAVINCLDAWERSSLASGEVSTKKALTGV